MAFLGRGMKGEAYWRRLVSGKRLRVADRLLRILLVIFALPYGWLLRLRAWGFRAGIFRTRHLDRPVISVGNIAVGGTGKTPMTALIARILLSQGKRVAVLSRGYGGTSSGAARIVSDGKTLFMTAAEAGDEPYLLARDVLGLIVVVGSDRYQAGRLADRELQPDVFLMDDGYQHLRLHRDLNILLLDGNDPFGNGWTLPAGFLREPKTAMRRADLIIFTRCDEGASPAIDAPAGIPVLSARHRLSGIVPLEGGETCLFSTLYGERVLAFAGIAYPDRFFAGLAEMGIDVVGSLSLPDHMVYDERSVAGIRKSFINAGATCLITTAKDAVKLEKHRKQLAKVWVAQLELEMIDPVLLVSRLESLFDNSRTEQ